MADSKLNDGFAFDFTKPDTMVSQMQTSAAAIATASSESKVQSDMLSLHWAFGMGATGASVNELPDVKPMFDAWQAVHYAPTTGRKALAETTEENYRSCCTRFAKLGFHFGIKGKPVAAIVIDEPKLKPQGRAAWISAILDAFPDGLAVPTAVQVMALKPAAAPKHVRDAVEDAQAAMLKAVGEKGSHFEAGTSTPVRAILRADMFAAIQAYVSSLPAAPAGGIDYVAQSKALRSDYEANKKKKEKKSE